MKRIVFAALALSLSAISLATEESASEAALTTDEIEALIKEKAAEQLKIVDKQLRMIDYFLDTYYKDYNFKEEDAHEYVSNPINTYMLIKRTSMEWPQLKKVLFNKTLDENYTEMKRLYDLLPEDRKNNLGKNEV